MHGHRQLSAHTHLTLELVRITAYPSGLPVQLALTATGRPARRALHQTRPLTDLAVPSARWSSLNVWAGTADLAVADPYLAPPGSAGHRHRDLHLPQRAAVLAARPATGTDGDPDRRAAADRVTRQHDHREPGGDRTSIDTPPHLIHDSGHRPDGRLIPRSSGDLAISRATS